MGFITKYQINQNTKGSTIYIMTKEDVNKFLTELNDFANVKTLFTDFSQYIISLRVYPINFINRSSTDINPWSLENTITDTGINFIQRLVKVGDKTAETAYGYLQIPDSFAIGEFQTERKYVDAVYSTQPWLDWISYSPYTVAQIYLPMLGYVDIDIDSIMRRYVQLNYFIDLATGMCNVYVLSYPNAVGDDGERLELSKSYKICADCPWSTSSEGLREREQAFLWVKDVLIDWPAKALGGFAGGWMGAVSSGAQATGTTIEESIKNAPRLLKGGSYEGNWLQTTMDLTPHILLGYRQPAVLSDYPYTEVKGIAVYNPVDTLQEISGYTVMSNVHINNSGTMFDTEVEELTQLLTSGVILP